MTAKESSDTGRCVVQVVKHEATVVSLILCHRLHPNYFVLLLVYQDYTTTGTGCALAVTGIFAMNTQCTLEFTFGFFVGISKQ
jgi:hypothetical protein